MAILGIREAKDIDLFVSPEVFIGLKHQGWQERIKAPDDRPLAFDVFEAHQNWDFSPYNPKLKELISRAQIVESVNFASLNDVIKCKTASGRPKDLVDLKLIDNYLSRNAN